jgi:predicted membrane channel-forming protein YqfA (hemolysin III family)
MNGKGRSIDMKRSGIPQHSEEHIALRDFFEHSNIAIFISATTIAFANSKRG